jgi:hypothetical protein
VQEHEGRTAASRLVVRQDNTITNQICHTGNSARVCTETRAAPADSLLGHPHLDPAGRRALPPPLSSDLIPLRFPTRE